MFVVSRQLGDVSGVVSFWAFSILVMAVVYVVSGRESSLVCGVPFGSSCVFHLIGFQSLSVVSAVTHSVAKLSSGCGGCNDLSSFWCVIVSYGYGF